jgi:hypothetical protein
MTLPDQGGQLYTLGLFEQLRVECKDLWARPWKPTSAQMHCCANSRTRTWHDIPTNVPRVEMWDHHDAHIRWGNFQRRPRIRSATPRSTEPSRTSQRTPRAAQQGLGLSAARARPWKVGLNTVHLGRNRRPKRPEATRKPRTFGERQSFDASRPLGNSSTVEQRTLTPLI